MRIKHIEFSENALRDSHHTIMGEYLLRDFGVRQDIASIIGAHHGKPTDADDKVEELRGYPERFYQEAKGIIYEQWHNMQDKIIRDALRETGFVDTCGEPDLSMLPSIGEMDAEQLWETTLDPERRMLKRVEIEDARMASSVTEMLMGTEVPPRRNFIYENATEAELDI